MSTRTEQWTPAQIEFRRWAIHVFCCRVCRIDDTRCARGRRLQAAHKQARMAERR